MKTMTPDYQIRADTRDVTATLRGRLVSLSLSDAAGIDSDGLSLVLDDRDGGIEMPRTGAELDVSLGYRDTGLVRMGFYVVDEVSLSGPPSTMTVRGRAADLRQGMKRPRTRPWDGVSLGDIVTAIAGEHGYEARIAAALAQEVLEHIDQVDESDLHFLTRLARERGALAKPAGGMLLFVLRGEAKSATGRDLPPVTLTAGEIGHFETTYAERGKYPAVRARWHDTADAEELSVTVGVGEPVYIIGRRYPDRPAAQKAAEARLDAFTRGVGTLRLTCEGNTRIAAEARLTVSGVRDGVNGEWTITRAVHRLDRGGYACDIEAESLAGGA